MSKCFCNQLHAKCDPTTCEKAKAGYPDTILYGELLSNGCDTCQILAKGLSVPEIKKVWHEAGGVWVPDENKLKLEWTPGIIDRTMIRTHASENGAYWRHFNFSLDPDAPQEPGACGDFPRQPKHPVAYTGSDEAFGWLHKWLEDCNEHHDCSLKEAPPLPTRILAIKEDRVVVEKGAGRHAFYTTLSHRWGSENPLMLTKKNAPDLFSNGIPLSLLPHTFRDAVDITTRLPQDIKYIWIDSLCIMQKDEEDWRREASTMAAVYGNSYLNIAAKHAEDENGGCFAYPEDKPPHKAFRIPGTDILVREAPRYGSRVS
jgi:hypothetical protein